MRPRFSMRWLLVFVTLVAIVCGILVRPTFLAHQFAAKVNIGDFSEVDSLGLRGHIWIYKKENGESYPYSDFRIEAVLHPLSWRDFFQFRRRVSINIWPPQNAKHLSGMTGVYAFVRCGGPKLGGETWE